MHRDSNSSMGRMVLVRVLVVVGALFAVLSLLAGYIRYQALDTDTVEQTASELIADPEIRDQIAATMVDQLFANVDVEAALEQRLPPDQKALAGPIAGAVRVGRRPPSPAGCWSGRGPRSSGFGPSPRRTGT